MSNNPGQGGFRSSMQRGPVEPGKLEKARDPRNALTRLLPYLLPFRLVLMLVLGFVLIYTILGLIGPYLMGVAIDKYIASQDVTGLAKIAIWMLVVYLLNNLFQAISAWLMSDVSQRALKQLRKDLFSHLQTLPIGFFDRNPAGELMSRLTNDIDAINQAVSQNVTSLLASVLDVPGRRPPLRLALAAAIISSTVLKELSVRTTRTFGPRPISDTGAKALSLT